MTKYTFYMHRICTIFLLVFDAYLFIPSFLLVFICMKIYSPFNPQSPVFVFLSQSQKLFHLPYFPIYASCKTPEIEGLLFCYSAILPFYFALLFCHSVFPCLPFSSPIIIGWLFIFRRFTRMADLIFSQIRNGLLSCYN